MEQEKRIVIWYLDGPFWRRGDGDDDTSPQDHGDGTEDLIFNNISKRFYEEDTSEESIESFMVCSDLLIKRKRYPDQYLTGYEASNMFVYWWKKKFTKQLVYKPQKRMSRDPFIALGSMYALFMYKLENETIKAKITAKFLELKIPFYLRYAIDTMIWWRRLKKDARKSYVVRLDDIKGLGSHFMYLKNYDYSFYQNTSS